MCSRWTGISISATTARARSAPEVFEPPSPSRARAATDAAAAGAFAGGPGPRLHTRLRHSRLRPMERWGAVLRDPVVSEAPCRLLSNGSDGAAG
jgi:hypothetical protein